MSTKKQRQKLSALNKNGKKPVFKQHRIPEWAKRGRPIPVATTEKVSIPSISFRGRCITTPESLEEMEEAKS